MDLLEPLVAKARRVLESGVQAHKPSMLLALLSGGDECQLTLWDDEA